MLKVSQCLNPDCLHKNRSEQKNCERCGSKLLLGDRYRAESYIGKGSFGRTFFAVDQHRLDTPCVIKQFLPSDTAGAAMEKSIQLFKQEAVRLRDLGKHPQIPDLEAFFEQEKRLYLIQEFIDGQDLLKEAHQKGKLSEPEIKQLLLELLPILQFIHDRQVIHRDIKPSNIIRRTDGTLFLIDFGVAKQQVENTTSEDVTITGTIGYAAPEQLLGRVVPASDLYALGATCVRLLTGCLPRSNSTELLYDPIEMEWKWRAYAVVNPTLGKVFDRLLEYRVSNRFQSAQEVLDSLKNSTVPLPRVQPPPPPPTPVLEPQRTVFNPQSSSSPYPSSYGQPPNQRTNLYGTRTQSSFSVQSDAGIDYSKLIQLLSSRKFREADKETFKLMLMATRRLDDGWLRAQDIETFPCSDLRTLDQLWHDYSKGRFGFGVQKAIYDKLREQDSNPKYLIFGFCNEVGWREGTGKWLRYDEISFSSYQAPKGHLPCGGPPDLAGGMTLSVSIPTFIVATLMANISQRLESCNS